MNAKPSSLLFCPGHRSDRFEKALTACPEGIVLDLEDGVGIADKATARREVFNWLSKRSQQPAVNLAVIGLRINAPQSTEGLEDIYSLAHAEGLPEKGWFFIPKLEDVGELAWVTAHLHRRLPKWGICGLVETGRGIRNLARLAASQPALVALGFGGADLRADLGLSNNFEAQLYARSRFVLEASGFGLHLMDVPHLAINAPKELQEECIRVKALGFHGKFAIHPNQVQIITNTFAPSTNQIEQAQRVITAYRSAGGNAVQIDGQMIDEPVYQHALATLAKLPT